MARLLILLQFIAGPFTIRAQISPVKILFIGNSFTINNNLTKIVTGLAQGAGIKAEVLSRVAWGQSINYFIKDRGCWNYIRYREWDYVVIQDNQRYYYDSIGKIDSLGHPSPLLENNIRFQDSIKKLIPGVKIIYFAGWEQKGGVPDMIPGDNTEKMILRILGNYQYMNNMHGVHNVIAPIGAAWIAAMKKRPYLLEHSSDSLLYVGDGRHPGAAGSYLAACVLFTTIFHKSPVDLKEDYQYVKPELKAFLQQTAMQAVIDNFTNTNLKSITPEIKIKGKTAYTNKSYASYQWYNDTIKIKEATTYKYTFTHIPTHCWVETTDAKGRRYWSFPPTFNAVKPK